MKKKVLVTSLCVLTAVQLFSGCGAGNSNTKEKKDEDTKQAINTETISISKSEKSNPIAGFDSGDKLTYGGDPAALVVGDTVYLYTGHDTALTESYVIPEWQCYSTKDMENWNYEGVILSCKDIGWADNNSAWAAQCINHTDPTTGTEKYYFYFCSWDSEAEGKQSIGVAVSDSPTGPFTDIGTSLIKGTLTENETSGWNDIDPTVWIETDENGIEHRYLLWGNGKVYICELNEDMISVKDLNGDSKITFGEDVIEKKTPSSFTEAPWLYRQADENGKYFGDYYLFYAYGWREQMAYARTADLLNGDFSFGNIIMEPSATSNTNHMSVIDFKGHTYFIYHNGSLPGGSGFRRVACIEEFKINDDGSIDYIEETATGISGNAVIINDNSGNKLAHYHFDNSTSDSSYPYKDILIGTGKSYSDATDSDCKWEINKGLSNPSDESLVSIESYNKPGLYITANMNGSVRLTQDAGNLLSANQTFRTVKGLNGNGISFESAKYAGKFIMLDENGNLTLGDGTNKDACTFTIE